MIPDDPAFVKKLPHRWLYITGAISGIFLIWIFINLYFNDSSQIAIVAKTIASSTPPLPTAMDPNFLTQVTDCFIPTAAVYGYDLRITSGFRSIADQSVLYQQGRTVNGTVVSEAPPGHSLHNYGYAVDVADRVRGYNINWTRLVKIAAYCSIESSGVGDLPHFEYRGGLTTDDFAAGKRPPPLTLPCTLMADRAASSTPLTRKDLTACGAPTF